MGDSHIKPGGTVPPGSWRVWTYRSLCRERCNYAGVEAVARELFVNLLLIAEANKLEGLELYDGTQLKGFLYRSRLLAELRDSGLVPRQGIQNLARASSPPTVGEEAGERGGMLDITALVEAQIAAILDATPPA